MSDNRTTELREKLMERGVEYTANDGEHVKETCWPYMGELMAAFAEYDNGTTRFACDTWCYTPEQAIAATLGSDASAVRLAERLRGIADEMSRVGASAMTPHELLACYAREVDKVADSLMFAATLGEKPAKSGADALPRRARDMARNIQGNLGRCLYRRKDIAEMEEVSETLMELANELNAELGSGTCEAEARS